MRRRFRALLLPCLALGEIVTRNTARGGTGDGVVARVVPGHPANYGALNATLGIGGCRRSDERGD